MTKYRIILQVIAVDADRHMEVEITKPATVAICTSLDIVREIRENIIKCKGACKNGPYNSLR